MIVKLKEPTDDERAAFRTWMLLNARRLEARYRAAVKLAKLHGAAVDNSRYLHGYLTESVMAGIRAAEAEWLRLR